MSNRLAREAEHKTKQAQKLLQMLKQKQKQKMQPQPQLLLGSDPQLSLSRRATSNADSFQTCLSPDSYLSQLYFKIFSEHMEDPSKAATDIENTMLNMRKELERVSEELLFVKKSNSKAEKQGEREKLVLENERLSREAAHLRASLQAQSAKYLELLERKTDALNTSGLNNSALYDGYQQKIKQLADKLEAKETEVAQIWTRNRTLQAEALQWGSKAKAMEREMGEIERERDLLMDMVQKLTEEVQRQEGEGDLVSAQVTKEVEKLKGELAKAEADNKGLRAEIETNIGRYNQLMRKHDQKQRQCLELIRKQKSTRQQIDKLQSTIATVSTQFQHKSQQAKTFQQQLTSQQSATTLQLQHSISQLSTVNKTLQLQLDALESQLQQSRSQIAQQSHSIGQKDKQLNQLTQMTQQLTAQLIKAQQDLEDMDVKIDVMKQENAEVMADRERHRVRAQGLEQESIRQSEEYGRVRARLEEQLEEQEVGLGVLREKYATAKDANAKLSAQIEGIKVEKVQLLQKIRQQQQQLMELKQRLLKLPATSDPTMVDPVPSNQTVDQPNAASHSLAQLNSQLQSQLTQTQSQLTHLEQQLQQNQNQVAKLTQQRSKYMKTIEQLTRELNEAYQKVNEHTRVSLEKGARNGSKEKADRPRSVNKLKSYFGFGNKGEE